MQAGPTESWLPDSGAKISMSRHANAWDNAPMESFFKTLKVERIYQVRYGTRVQARLDIFDRVEGYCNRGRLHTSVGFVTPCRLRGGDDRNVICCPWKRSRVIP